ncbi:MAG TPA: hypothetical protein PKL84_00940 [Candidatus Hydrogenedentes bacterium]|nr:hypothetical protein [Candidatus Hydrogenedentota bacterium]
MNTIEIGDASKSLGEYAGREDALPLVVTEHGRPIAALVPLHDADMETIALSTDPTFIRLIEHSRERRNKEGGISAAEMRRRPGTS